MRTLLLCSALLIASSACGDDAATPADATPDAEDYTLGDAPALAMPCSDALADLYTLPSSLPQMDDSRRGDVFRCTVTEKLTVPQIRDQIAAYNTGHTQTTESTVTSGFWTYRIAYRSTRNTVNNTRAEGDTAAVLLVPAKPLMGAPLVVWGHGSVGVAEKCAPSRLDLSASSEDQDFPPMLYRLAGYGFTVIAPDYAGFAYGQTPGFFNAEDEAHAILDATRAAAKLLPAPPSQVLFVGHSQGGHAVLSAHAHAKSYGMAGTLAGVVALAPLWSSMSLWAAATTDAANLNTTDNTNAIIYAMAYAYAAGELREGAGRGVDVFKVDKQAAAKAVLVGGECYAKAELMALGTKPSEFFDDAYVNTVGGACAVNPFTPDCSDPLAAKWKSYWVDDRPPVDPQGAPLMVYFGGMDKFVPTGRAACVKTKITADLMTSGATTAVQYCNNAMAEHRNLVRGSDVDHALRWLAAKVGAGAEPEACTPFPDAACAVPPNDY